MSEYIFVDETLKNTIKNIIVSVFPILNSDGREILEIYLIRIINIIAIIFNFYPNKEDYIFQLQQNDYQDIKWLLLHLLPFINETNIQTLTSLDDLFEKKVDNSDINMVNSKYVYSNIQYNRSIRNSNSSCQHRKFDKKYLDHNFYLLLETLKIMSHKMLVNWMDIIPYDKKTYQDTPLYRKTYLKFLKQELDDWIPNIDASLEKTEKEICLTITNKYCGLSMHDIYNTISYELYVNIKDIKWLLYDIPCYYTDKKSYFPIIIILTLIFDTDMFIQDSGVEWTNLIDEFQNKFENTWNDLIKNSITKKTWIFGNIIELKREDVQLMLKGICLSFNNKYKNIEKAIDDNYKEIEDNYNEDEDIDDEEENNKRERKIIQFNDIYVNIISIPVQHMYEFMRDCLQQIKHSWYGLKFLNDEKTSIKKILLSAKDYEKLRIYYNTVYGNDTLQDNDIAITDRYSFKYEYHFDRNDGINFNTITYKNIYNFAKSFIHKTDKKKFIKLPYNWCSLTSDDKKLILDRINNMTSDFFNISGYIKRLYPDFIKVQIDDKISQIYNCIHDNIISIIFESLIVKGVLTNFIPNKNITNTAFISKDLIHTKLVDTLFKVDSSNSNTIWTDSYHYLTGLPYKFMKGFKLPNEQKKEDDKNKYIQYDIFKYNSKDAWYKASALDWIAQIGFCHHFIHNRVIYITGATGVGKSTQVPNLFLYYVKAIDYNSKGKVVCSQPRIPPTEKNAEIVSTWFGVPIKIYDVEKDKEVPSENFFIQQQNSKKDHVKDISSLCLKYITDGALLLEMSNPILKAKKTKNKKIEYRETNIYDVIMVDEAHEHNKSMDLILTLLKLPASYNNSIRIVILSATMDSDEPRYRQFYRDINDNKKFPLDMWIKDNTIDRINVDRRFHISPPGQSTRYNIKDLYVPDKTEEEVVKEILSTSTSGDILIFQPGQGEITKLVESLNKNTPKNVIALPYYSQLNAKQKDFIEKIDKKLKELKIGKKPLNEYENLTEGDNSYDRAIIVATNVAEASITISSLKYVIDTGTQKTNKFDFHKKANILESCDISESSRMQRRGRVGRKSSGTVYYLYKKGKMENNKIKFLISLENIYLEFYKNLYDNNSEKVFISENNNPNNPKVRLSINDFKKSSRKFTQDISKILKSLYFCNDEYYNYYGNDEHYDYNNYKNTILFYETGYSIDTIKDEKGEFYIIHPDELLIQRNIIGDITGTEKSDIKKLDDIEFIKETYYKGKIESKKINLYVEALQQYMYLNIRNSTINKTINKTNLGKHIIKLNEKLQIEDHSLLRTLIFGKILKQDFIINIVAFYSTIQFDLLNLFKVDDKNKPLIGKFKAYYNSNNLSDTQSIENLLIDFHGFLNILGIVMELNDERYIKYAIEASKGELYKSMDSYKYLLDPINNKDKKTNKIDVDSKKILKTLQENINSVFNKNLKKYTEKIINWCDNRDINSDIIFSYINNFTNLQLNLKKYIDEKFILFLEQMQNIFTQASQIKYKKIDTILLALMFGFPFNICKKISGSHHHYLSVYNPTINNLYTIQSLSFWKYIPCISFNPVYTENYILYLQLKLINDEMSIIHYINKDILTFLNNIYNNEIIMNYTITSDSITKFIDTLFSDKDIDLKQSKQILHAISLITKNIKEIKLDFHNNQNKDILIDRIISL